MLDVVTLNCIIAPGDYRAIDTGCNSILMRYYDIVYILFKYVVKTADFFLVEFT